MKPLIFFSLFLLACNSYTKQGSGNNSAISTEVLDTSFYSNLKNRFREIDSLSHTDQFEKADSLKENIASFLQANKEILYKLPDTSNFDLLYISRSTDKNLCLISWDTRQGGTMINFATIAVFKTSNGIKSKLLRDTIIEMGDTYMHFDSIITIETIGKQKIYLAKGFGQGSTALPWQEIRAFSINSDTLSSPAIFPERNSIILVEFDTHQFGEDDSIPAINLKNFGKTILIPQSTENGGFSKKYKTLVFSDTVYTVK